METLKSSDSPRVIAEKIDKNLSLSEKGYKYHFDVKPPANPDEKTLWIDLFVKTIIKEINTKTYADEYFAAHPSINKNTFKYIGDDGKPTLEFKKMLYGDDYDPDAKYILQPKNNIIADFCKPIDRQPNVPLYDLSKILFNTKNISSYYFAFNNTPNLAKIDASGWDISKATNINGVFRFAVSIKELNLSKWDTSKVTNMSEAFMNCTELISLDVSKWNTINVTDMSKMFSQNPNLPTVNLSNWNTSKVTNMSYMFNIDGEINNLNLTNWDVGSVKNMESMFTNCSKLNNIGDISNWDTKNLENINGMFSSCVGFTNVNLSNWNTRKLIKARGTFSATNFKTLDISNWDTSNVVDMSFFVAYNRNLTTINGVLDFKSCTDYNGIFNGCTKLTSVKVKNLPVDIDTFCATAEIDKSKVIVVA